MASGRVSKNCSPRPSSPRRRATKALEEKLLDAVAERDAPIQDSHGKIPESLTCSASKRRRDEAYDDEQPAKRSRLTAHHESERADKEQQLSDLSQRTQAFLDQDFPASAIHNDNSNGNGVDGQNDEDHPENRTKASVSQWLENISPGHEKKDPLDDQSADRQSDNSCVHNQQTNCTQAIREEDKQEERAERAEREERTRHEPSDMDNTRDADGFVRPPTPSSARAVRQRAGSDSAGSAAGYGMAAGWGAAPVSDFSGRSSGKSLVEEPKYRSWNLADNHIFMRDSGEDLPEHVARLVDQIRQGGRLSSGDPAVEQIRRDKNLHELEYGVLEPQVEDFFKGDRVFPFVHDSEVLIQIGRQPMARQCVPSHPDAQLKISNPVPDMLYGYNEEIFPVAQRIAVDAQTVVNKLLYPFLLTEFKGEGGSLYVATNQCMGGAAACVNVAENLNRQLAYYERAGRPDEPANLPSHCLNSAIFSVAINGSEARLHVSWKDGDNYHMQRIDSFALQVPDHYLKFRRYVHNIIDWGETRRLKEIRDALDRLFEEGRRRTAEAAKSRPHPPPASPGRAKRGRSTSVSSALSQADSR